MNSTQRRQLQERLTDLEKRRDMPLNLWSELVEGAIRDACPPESQIHAQLRSLRPEAEPTEPNAVDKDRRHSEYPPLLRAARRILDARPFVPPAEPTPDPTLEQQVLAIINNKLLDTPVARLLKWIAPLAVVVIFGGTLYAGWQVTGFYTSVRNEMRGLADDVNKASAKAINEIEAARGDSKRGALKAIADEERSAVQSIHKAAGDEKSGAISNVLKARTDAVERIEKIVGSEQTRDTTLFLIAEKRNASIKSIDQAEKSALNALPKQVADLKKELEEFKPTAVKVTEAREILSGADQRASVAAIVRVLDWSKVMVLALCGIAGALGAIIVVATAKKVGWIK
jgi:hypothetical protein